MKHILITLSLLLLSSPVIGQETGVLYLYETSSGLEWKTFGDGEVQPKYKGGIKNGEPEGFGILTSSDGEKYIGEFKDGKWEGQGTFTFPNGQKYIGEFKDGKQNGQGTYTQYGSLLYPDGRKYVGEYKNGKEWNGTYYNNNGKKEYKLVNGKIE